MILTEEKNIFNDSALPAAPPSQSHVVPSGRGNKKAEGSLDQSAWL